MWAREVAAQDLDDASTVTNVVSAWYVERPRPRSDTARRLFPRLPERTAGAGAVHRCRGPLPADLQPDLDALGDRRRRGLRSATLHVGHIGRPPREGRDPYAVTAVTPWPPDDDETKVDLHIHPERSARRRSPPSRCCWSTSACATWRPGRTGPRTTARSPRDSWTGLPTATSSTGPSSSTASSLQRRASMPSPCATCLPAPTRRRGGRVGSATAPRSTCESGSRSSAIWIPWRARSRLRCSPSS